MRRSVGGRWRQRWTVRAFRAAVAATLVFGVWLVGFECDPADPAVLPDTTEQFSLDLEVLATEDAPVVYAVEQRARPNYRVFRFDPATGEIDTVFTVPTDAIIYGIDIDPTGSTLALAYTPDIDLDGSGLWTLDLDSSVLAEAVPVVPGIYLTDPEWNDDGAAILATRVDRRTGNDQLDVVRADVATGAIDLLAANGVNPTVDGDLVHYLGVDPETSARRSIRRLVRTTGTDSIVAGGDVDLDHLIGDAQQLTVAVLDSDDPAGRLTLGTPAAAHGNHDLPSTWWTVTDLAPTDLEPATVYDADLAAGTLVSVTREGLSIGTGPQTLLIASRALRFVAVSPS